MKITIASMNLSANCTNRSLRLAQALATDYEVEIVGPIFGVGNKWGKVIWPPLCNVDIPIRSVPGDILPWFAKSIVGLVKLMDGDVIIACKPRFPSFGVALIRRGLTGTPVILDVDDDELAQTRPGKSAPLRQQLTHTHGYLYTRVVHHLHDRADSVFTVSDNFRNKYGGVIVPHGMDPKELDPALYDRDSIRSELGIGSVDKIIGFVGTVNPQKGIDLILQAMEKINRPEVKLMIIGAEVDDTYAQSLSERYGNRVILVPPQPLDRIPYYLSAHDLVVLPQRNWAVTYGQMPAKLTDAMAMGKPVIGAARSDIPKYLEGRGLLFEAENQQQLVEQLCWCLNHPAQAKVLGQNARAYFLQYLTFAVMRDAMRPEIERVYAKRGKSRLLSNNVKKT